MTNKLIFKYLITLFLFSPSLLYAFSLDKCTHLEYAELQSMNKKSLLFECTINKLKISNNNSTRKYYESIKDIDSKTIGARKNATNESEEKIQEVWKLNKECTEVIFRIRRILKTKKTNDETIEQSCSMP